MGSTLPETWTCIRMMDTLVFRQDLYGSEGRQVQLQ